MQNFVFTLIYFKSFSTINKLNSKQKEIDHIYMIINSQKRSFGRGAKVSLFTLGTMRATESLEKMYGIIKNAHYVGINHIETAPSYGNAESLIGNSIKKLALEENIKEKNWVITSKVLPKGDFDFLKLFFKKSKSPFGKTLEVITQFFSFILSSIANFFIEFPISDSASP